ncbi:MAG: Gx transporter family protein [Lachnospiraceae bacterium]|nr:Gx transporter family protein [Lachnospiraceae bacterium]MCH4030290.1 Gx transporter family protein [Lachnospiraceae bacterium]MCH4069502.1 Gx transporter family protein [Lachnospiraceae bacterium]MCH4107562.1 Gx transporter family protein [Lachnospiraceae bacterium]MCI1301587.1 Gx transporter family protein [Lachnospiraceae bacterium]
MRDRKVQKMVTAALFTGAAILFGYVETLLPIPLPVPGMKLGLANIAVLAVLYTAGPVMTVASDLVRILVCGLLFTGLYGFLFSLAGGMVSLLVEILLFRSRKFGVTGVSVAGAVAHQAGQILVAVPLLGSSAVAGLFPVLGAFAIGTGVVIGLTASELIRHLPGSEKV